MESSRSDVWHQSEGERALIRASRDAIRDFVTIPYNARGALMPYKSFGLDKKRTKRLLRSFKGYEKDIFREFHYGFELKRILGIFLICNKLLAHP